MGRKTLSGTPSKRTKTTTHHDDDDELMDLDNPDNLLERAAKALALRRQQQQQQSERRDAQDASDIGRDEAADKNQKDGADKKKAEPSERLDVLKRVKLEPRINATHYITSTSKTGPARLNSTQITLSKPTAAPTNAPATLDGVDEKVAKGLAKTAEIERLVVKKKKEVIPPELDYDAKTKAKMAKAAETTGKKWFDMPAPEITPALKLDLALLASRSALDPKRHYKKTDAKAAIPKFFHIGTIVNPAEAYHSGRLTRKERSHADSFSGSAGIVKEVLKDATVKTYVKNKYKKLQTANAERFAPYRRPSGRGGKNKGKKK